MPTESTMAYAKVSFEEEKKKQFIKDAVTITLPMQKHAPTIPIAQYLFGLMYLKHHVLWISKVRIAMVFLFLIRGFHKP